MKFRKIKENEVELIYKMGYKEWAKGRTYEQYVKDNKKEEDYGFRYGYIDEEHHTIIGSLILLNLHINNINKPLYGLGSIVISQDYQNMGYGKLMIKECLSQVNQEEKEAMFLLYSDINPSYYEQFGFKKLPSNQQKISSSICMIKCSDEDYESISKISIDRIPPYF